MNLKDIFQKAGCKMSLRRWTAATSEARWALCTPGCAPAAHPSPSRNNTSTHISVMFSFVYFFNLLFLLQCRNQRILGLCRSPCNFSCTALRLVAQHKLDRDKKELYRIMVTKRYVQVTSPKMLSNFFQTQFLGKHTCNIEATCHHVDPHNV